MRSLYSLVTMLLLVLGLAWAVLYWREHQVQDTAYRVEAVPTPEASAADSRPAEGESGSESPVAEPTPAEP